MTEETQSRMVPIDAKIEVNIHSLADLLQALEGPGHLIREMQATRDVCKMLGDDNPIEELTNELQNWMNTSPDTLYTIAGKDKLITILEHGLPTTHRPVANNRDRSPRPFDNSLEAIKKKAAELQKAGGRWEGQMVVILSINVNGLKESLKQEGDDLFFIEDRIIEPYRLLSRLEIVRPQSAAG